MRKIKEKRMQSYVLRARKLVYYDIVQSALAHAS